MIIYYLLRILCGYTFSSFSCPYFSFFNRFPFSLVSSSNTKPLLIFVFLSHFLSFVSLNDFYIKNDIDPNETENTHENITKNLVIKCSFEFNYLHYSIHLQSCCFQIVNISCILCNMLFCIV